MNVEHEKPKLQYAKDLSIFQVHELNRDIAEKPALLESMEKHKFMPSSPIQCVREGGKLKVIRGHHRLHYAKRLGLGVWYVIDPSNTNLYDLEGDSSSRWTLSDFVHSRAKSGDENCQMVLDYKRRHGIGLGPAVSLMGGESAGSMNLISRIKRGTYRVAKDLSHASLVGELVDYCRASGFSYAGETSFVNALSSICRIPEFEPSVLKQRVSKMPSLLTKHSTVKGYLVIIEEVYNYGAKGKRVNLAFRAEEVGRERQASFGGKR